MTNSTIQRTLAECKKLGWPAAVVEKWIAPARRRQDLFGLFDVVALSTSIIGIQACGASGDAAAHIRKMTDKETPAFDHLTAWLAAGGIAELWAWRKVGDRGKRKLWARRTLRLCLIAGGLYTDEDNHHRAVEDWAIEAAKAEEQQP